jgi:heterodisulfide reductase subunit B
MNNEISKSVPPGLAYIAANITAKDNILGLPAGEKAKWAEGLEFPKDKPSTVFFAGCGYQYSPMLEQLVTVIKTADKMSGNPDLPVLMAHAPKKLGVDVAGLYTKMASRGKAGDGDVLRDAVSVIRALGMDPGYLGSHEPCCGAPLYHTGLQTAFAANAEKAFRKLKSSGVKEIISIVPSCTYALLDLFPKMVPGFDIKVKHFIEVVAENVRQAKFSYPHKVKVTYHDPCQLGRYMGLIDQPRQVLRSIHNVELVEPAWTSGEWSTCCGGGGGFEVVFPQISETLAMGRVTELAATGADIILTQCPGCLMQLRAGLQQLKKTDTQVMDLATLLAKSLPREKA